MAGPDARRGSLIRRIGPVPADPAYLGFRAASLVAQALPGAMVKPAVGVLGRAGPRVMAERRLLVQRNLSRAHGRRLSDAELRRGVAETFASYARYWAESFRLPGTAAADLDRDFTTHGFDHVQAGLDAGSGVILALPHLGGWEWAAFWLAEIQGLPVTAVVEPVEPAELADWFLSLRASFGITAVPLGPESAAACARTLRANQILCLLCDRDLAGGGIAVEFFGERTTLPGGPATLALRTGAPLLPSAVYFDGSGHRGVAGPPLAVERRGRLRDDVARITQDLAVRLEELIRAAPEQWHLMSPNWPSDHVALESHRMAG